MSEEDHLRFFLVFFSLLSESAQSRDYSVFADLLVYNIVILIIKPIPVMSDRLLLLQCIEDDELYTICSTFIKFSHSTHIYVYILEHSLSLNCNNNGLIKFQVFHLGVTYLDLRTTNEEEKDQRSAHARMACKSSQFLGVQSKQPYNFCIFGTMEQQW